MLYDLNMQKLRNASALNRMRTVWFAPSEWRRKEYYKKSREEKGE